MLYPGSGVLHDLSLTDLCRLSYLDGGALLHLIPWPCGLTYDNIYDLYYFKYACQNYSNDSNVVFDGYTEMPSPNDTAHIVGIVRAK